MSPNPKQIKLLTRLSDRQGPGCKVSTLVNAFKKCSVQIEKIGCNYTFQYKQNPPLTIVFSAQKTPHMTKMPKELSELSKKTLFDNVQDFRPGYLTG